MAAAHGAMAAFLQRCGLARHLQLEPMKPGAEPPDQASSLPTTKGHINKKNFFFSFILLFFFICPLPQPKEATVTK